VRKSEKERKDVRCNRTCKTKKKKGRVLTLLKNGNRGGFAGWLGLQNQSDVGKPASLSRPPKERAGGARHTVTRKMGGGCVGGVPTGGHLAKKLDKEPKANYLERGQ